MMKVVNRYIGVAGGYIGDFSYRTHAEFYPEYCDLAIDPNNYAGTTRERFIEIRSTPRSFGACCGTVAQRPWSSLRGVPI